MCFVANCQLDGFFWSSFLQNDHGQERKIETTNEVPSYITRPTRVGKGSYLQFQQKIKSSNQWSPLQSLSLTRILLNLSKGEGENMFNPDLFIYFL